MFHRTLISVGASILGAALMTQPVFALGWNDGAFTGKVGAFSGPPAAEVVCRYNAAGRLRSVTVQPLTMFGSHSEATLVGWRYQLREATEFRRGRLVYLGPTWKALATESSPAEGFQRHRFYVHEDLPGTSAYYVRPVMFWYEPGSPTSVEGRAVVLYDRYLLKQGTESRWSNACSFDYTRDFGS